MSEENPYEGLSYPWDEFPDDRSTFLDCIKEYKEIRAENERLKGDEAWLEHRLTKTLMDAEKGRAERCIRLTTERAEVLQVLEFVKYNHKYTCPSCLQKSADGCTDDCKLNALIKKIKEGK